MFRKVATGHHHSKGCNGKKPSQEFVPFGEKVLSRHISTELMNTMSPRHKFGLWFGMRNNGAQCFSRHADGVLRAREIRRMEPQSRWRKESSTAPWRLSDGKWTVDRPKVRADPISTPPLPFTGAGIQRDRIAKQGIEEYTAQGAERFDRRSEVIMRRRLNGCREIIKRRREAALSHQQHQHHTN